MGRGDGEGGRGRGRVKGKGMGEGGEENMYVCNVAVVTQPFTEYV